MKHAGLALAGLLLAACSSSSTLAANPDAAHLNLAVKNLRQGQVVDSIPCLSADLPEYHWHVHVGVYVDGVEVKVPAGIGVGRPWGFDSTGFLATGACFAFLHTHDTSGIVHIAEPTLHGFTLSQLFSVWGQPLTRSGAFNYAGALTVLVDGRPFAGDPGAVTLANYENVVIELGKPPKVTPASIFDFRALRQ